MMRQRLAIGLLALLLTIALAPPAGADHSYSHRFVFEGRVVDAEGLPLPGREVEFYSIGGSFGGPCQEGHRRITDENGDFRFCYHVHELDPSTRTGVRVGNATPVEKPMDTAFRRTVVTVVVDDENGTAPAEWDRTFSVTGKVWRRGATILEGVPVHGTALAGTPVNVTLRTANGSLTEETLIADQYGDFDATFELVEGVDPAEVQLVLESMGHLQRRPLATFAHRQTVGFLLPPEAAGDPIDVSFPGDEGSDPDAPTLDAASAPGARSPTIPAPLFVGVALFAIVTIIVRKRRG